MRLLPILIRALQAIATYPQEKKMNKIMRRRVQLVFPPVESLSLESRKRLAAAFAAEGLHNTAMKLDPGANFYPGVPVGGPVGVPGTVVGVPPGVPSYEEDFLISKEKIKAVVRDLVKEMQSEAAASEKVAEPPSV